MKKKYNWIQKILITVTICLALILTAFLYLLIQYDQRFGYHFPQREFIDNQRNDPYAQGVPLYEMNFWTYLIEYPADTAVYTELNKMIVLPCNVDYYERKDDPTPALTLEKGTEICMFPGHSGFTSDLTGYGAVCWPDYEEEWRYGCPFITEDIDYAAWDYSAAYIRIHDMYYVKSSQLEKVVRAFYNANKSTLSKSCAPWAYPKLLTQSIDQFLYLQGAFCPERWKK